MRNDFFSFICDSISRKRSSLGYGIHSPFVFYLIAELINDKSHYYAFQLLDEIRKELLVSYPYLNEKVRSVVKSEKYYHVLLKLAHYMKSENIIEYGNSLAISSLYLSAHKSTCKSTIFNLSNDLMNIAEKITSKIPDKSFSHFNANNPFDIEKKINAINSIDVLYLGENSLNSFDIISNIYSLCLPKFHDNSFLIVENIGQENIMLFWNSLCNDKNVTVALDMKSFGIAFFNTKLHKRNYKLSFKM